MRDNVNKPERILILAGLLVNFRIEKSTKYCIKTIPQKNRRVCSSSVCSSIIQRKEIISAVAAFIATSRCHVILHAINVIAALYKCSARLMSPPSPRLGLCANVRYTKNIAGGNKRLRQLIEPPFFFNKIKTISGYKKRFNNTADCTLSNSPESFNIKSGMMRTGIAKRDNVNKPARILTLAGLFVKFKIEKSTTYGIKTIPQKNSRV